MSRPKIPRKICHRATASVFKPNGMPTSDLPKVYLACDELEALRLVDFDGLQQQQASIAMGVSRQTLANIVKAARAKMAECLLNQKALVISGKE